MIQLYDFFLPNEMYYEIKNNTKFELAIRKFIEI